MSQRINIYERKVHISHRASCTPFRFVSIPIDSSAHVSFVMSSAAATKVTTVITQDTLHNLYLLLGKLFPIRVLLQI